MRLYNSEDRFTEEDDEHRFNRTDGIIVPRVLWERWIETCQTTMLIRLVQGELQQIGFVAGYHKDDIDSVYAPSWMFYKMKAGEPVFIEEMWEDGDEEEPLPLATKIHLRPLDNEIYQVDIVEEVSNYLSNFQCLQQGSTIVVPINALGGFLVDMFVEMCEPEGEVLLRGEVALELVAPLEDLEPPVPSAPVPSAPSAPQFQESKEETDFTEMFSSPQPNKNQQKYFTGRSYKLGS